ncbi:PspC domain-containing protein [Paenibacillus yanchengensis]|uniref:PspC domain-containing protein n=1 Tax=Paenibacillus yanchengensis TaxID=2035833 RepID=A0ABW4YRK9_9BACL
MIALKKLYRSRRDSKLTGLCGGLSEYMNVDATLIRILLIVASIFSSGIVVFIYIVAAMVVPKEPHDNSQYGHGNYYNGSQYGPPPGGGHGQQYYGPNHNNQRHGPTWNDPPRQYNQQNEQQFDSMMDDLEKKALRREIEELKSKLEESKKGDNNNGNF